MALPPGIGDEPADSSEIHLGRGDALARGRVDQAGESTRMTRLAIRSLVRSA
jgi:hypothetical protein